MLKGILILVFFLGVTALVMTKKLPTLVALPMLAILICAVAGVPLVGTDAEGKEIGWLQTVFEAGTVRMASPIVASVFGAWLGALMNRTGVTSAMIKKSAELGGDRPLVVTLAMAIVVALLFTVLSGLGCIIMVGSIVIPILISVGLPAMTAACVFLLSFTAGLSFNVANWQTFVNLFGMEIGDVKRFELYMLIATALATVAFILIEFKRNGIRFAFSAPAKAEEESEKEGETDEAEGPHGFTGAMCMLSPLIPIVLVAALNVPVTVAFTVSILWLLLFSSKGFLRSPARCFKKAMNTLTRTCYEAISGVAPAMILMINIGILYLAVSHGTVKEALDPLLRTIIPSGRIFYVLFFIAVAPLSLYRGPMNLFGIGSGLAGVIAGLGTLPLPAVMGAFLSSERIQCCGDPTNTQNAWVANFAEVDVTACTRKLLPYLWAVAAVGVILSSVLYF